MAACCLPVCMCACVCVGGQSAGCGRGRRVRSRREEHHAWGVADEERVSDLSAKGARTMTPPHAAPPLSTQQRTLADSIKAHRPTPCIVPSHPNRPQPPWFGGSGAFPLRGALATSLLHHHFISSLSFFDGEHGAHTRGCCCLLRWAEKPQWRPPPRPRRPQPQSQPQPRPLNRLRAPTCRRRPRS